MAATLVGVVESWDKAVAVAIVPPVLSRSARADLEWAVNLPAVKKLLFFWIDHKYKNYFFFGLIENLMFGSWHESCVQVDSFLIEEGASGSPSEGEPEPEFLLSRPPGPPHSPPQAAEPVDPETQVFVSLCTRFLSFGICVHTRFGCYNCHTLFAPICLFGICVFVFRSSLVPIRFNSLNLYQPWTPLSYSCFTHVDPSNHVYTNVLLEGH